MFAGALVSNIGTWMETVALSYYVADGKGGADWRPMRGVAHRLVIGAEEEGPVRGLSDGVDRPGRRSGRSLEVGEGDAVEGDLCETAAGIPEIIEVGRVRGQCVIAVDGVLGQQLPIRPYRIFL